MPGEDYIFHAAALKQVPSCEFFPMVYSTNVYNDIKDKIEGLIEDAIANAGKY